MWCWRGELQRVRNGPVVEGAGGVVAEVAPGFLENHGQLDRLGSHLEETSPARRFHHYR